MQKQRFDTHKRRRCPGLACTWDVGRETTTTNNETIKTVKQSASTTGNQTSTCNVLLTINQTNERTNERTTNVSTWHELGVVEDENRTTTNEGRNEGTKKGRSERTSNEGIDRPLLTSRELVSK